MMGRQLYLFPKIHGLSKWKKPPGIPPPGRMFFVVRRQFEPLSTGSRGAGKRRSMAIREFIIRMARYLMFLSEINRLSSIQIFLCQRKEEQDASSPRYHPVTSCLCESSSRYLRDSSHSWYCFASQSAPKKSRSFSPPSSDTMAVIEDLVSTCKQISMQYVHNSTS